MKFELRHLGALALCTALGACSGGVPGSSAPLPNAAAPSAQLAPLNAGACPKAGTVVHQGKLSVKIANATTIGQGTGLVTWRLDFKGLTQTQYDHLPVWHPGLAACGPQAKPMGRVSVIGGSKTSSCTNGVCDGHLTYTIRLVPPPTFPGNKPVRFNLLRLSPKPNTEYKFFNAVVWLAKP